MTCKITCTTAYKSVYPEIFGSVGGNQQSVHLRVSTPCIVAVELVQELDPHICFQINTEKVSENEDLLNVCLQFVFFFFIFLVSIKENLLSILGVI